MALLPERAAPRPLRQQRRRGSGGGGASSGGGRGDRNAFADALSNLSPVGRATLAFALLWPILYLCLLPSSSSSGGGGSSSTVGSAGGNNRELGGGGGGGGAGPIESSDASAAAAAAAAAAASRSSRVGVVVVGTDPDRVLKSVESVFLATEWDRVFSVVAVLDGVQSDPATSSKFDSVDRGRTPSPSSLALSSKVSRRIRTALGADGGKGESEEVAGGEGERQHRHSRVTLKERKVKVVYSSTKKGVNASRRYGAEFLRLLQRKHEDAGIKPPEEEIVLLLLRSDATLLLPDEGGGSWLNHVSSALNFGVAEESKVANAVSLAVDYVNGPGGTVSGGLVSPRRVVRSVDGMTVGFDLTLRPHWIHPKEGEGDGGVASSPYVTTPALLGAATAIRLDVFASLPARDAELKTQFAADLELTLNLWLCGDGIDVVSTARVAVDPVVLTEEEAQITDENAARIAAAWMGTTHQAAVFEARAKNDAQQESMAQIAQEAVWARNLPANLRKKCRPFAWYAEEMNRDVYIPGVVADIDVAVEGADLGGTATDEEGAGVQPEPEVQQPDAKPKEVFREQVQSVKEYLSETNREIISHAKPQDIRFVDYSGGGKEHPHLGANDEHGHLGYVHDATALRRDPPPFHVSDLTSTCRDDGNFKMLTKKVAVDMTAHNAAERMGGKRDKIFCVVYTTEKNHGRIPAIRETWGQKCDGFMVASTKTDPNLGTVDIVHEGPEEYNNIWQKVRSIWSYVYHNYYEDYEWFHIGGDDLYVLVENLRLYLESDEIRSAANGGKAPPRAGQPEKIQTPLFLGRRFANSGDMKRIFISGGSGYTMNKAALKALVSSLDTCFGHMHTFSEDTMVATCFRKQGIFPFDTRDEQGSERYMPFSPQHHLTYRKPPPEAKDWYPLYTIGELKIGLDHCSSHSVAFHYIDTELMRRMHAILYGHCRSV